MADMVTPNTVSVGDIGVTALFDAEGDLGNLSDLFPGVTDDAWDRYRALYPTMFSGRSGWWLPFGCFLIRSGERKILIDTGIGVRLGEFASLWRSGQLMTSLGLVNTSANDIDTVFLTHLHTDHIGGNVDERGAPAFPRARYITHRDGWRWANTPERKDLPPIAGGIIALKELGVLEFVAEEAELARGVVVIPTPGHAPGHMSVRVKSRGRQMLILGDVATHPAQTGSPDWIYVFDMDPIEAVDTRRLLSSLAAPPTVVACGHYPAGGFGRLRWTPTSSVWVPASEIGRSRWDGR